MTNKKGIPGTPKEIHSKTQALNYCILECPNARLGCAVECPIRKKWKLPPHGEKYYE